MRKASEIYRAGDWSSCEIKSDHEKDTAEITVLERKTEISLIFKVKNYHAGPGKWRIVEDQEMKS